MPLECLHEQAIRIGEVVELPRKFVLPLHSVKKIIPKAKNDNEERGQNEHDACFSPPAHHSARL